jgi:polysaccharide biosynthesis/export protein VpsN
MRQFSFTVFFHLIQSIILINCLFISSSTCADQAQPAGTPAIKSSQATQTLPFASDVSSYKLGSGDMISISVFGEDDMSVNKFRLTDAGTFLHSVLGEIKVLGLTVGELEKRVADGLRGRYLLNPRVSVRIDEYRSFFINGLVAKPGAYPYLPGLNVQKAALLAGGIKESADPEKIKILRETPSSIGYEKADLNSFILPGDTIDIGEYLPIYLSGMVQKTGSYPYMPGLNIQKAVSLAGGFSERASLNKIYITRNGASSPEPEKANLNTPVYQGDSITVDESFF